VREMIRELLWPLAIVCACGGGSRPPPSTAASGEAVQQHHYHGRHEGGAVNDLVLVEISPMIQGGSLTTGSVRRSASGYPVPASRVRTNARQAPIAGART
jgi:hypothetical protein